MSLPREQQGKRLNHHEMNKVLLRFNVEGEGKQSERSPPKRSFGGRQFERNEYPWTVTLIMTSPGRDLSLFSALSVMRSPENIFVFIGINKLLSYNNLNPKLREALHNVSKITVHNFDHCYHNNDLALIELTEDVSEAHSTPICMPNENLKLYDVLYASGSGMDPSLPKTLTDPGQYSRGKQVVAQKLYGVDDTSHMIATVTFSKSPQPGDSGGPLFQVDESETHTLVGITSLAVVGYAWKPDIGETNHYENQFHPNYVISANGDYAHMNVQQKPSSNSAMGRERSPAA
ncbi:trypsin [Ancylostoma ceylanicum]|uniref:Trypsin n=1 Tax=Ancylostoma ceylanicum TaxID=53326 RepID=A0A0D6M8F3_9BILA|nr:trypsin [Ancylostoma ceylanicum]